ncbi:ATP-binding protein [Pleionea sp. CnH1-48]|uniref:hybrid sensor histidine kinase/response regulator transcription factor n=1 Tax=Pleionea sp. CnH1-48 TaxID=2954494 RepID=UPI0020973A6B|nr:ATP-binding protein [Pleionea sp. CnH1-48]MCO7224751.1 ATP-binding protein [Pleionea sp. CnH1-48]
MIARYLPYLTIIFLSIAAPISSNAELLKSTYPVKRLSGEIALPQQTVRHIIKDEMGYVWIGTQDGLSRFDGHSIKNYLVSEQEKTQGLGSQVRHLMLSRSGHILVVTEKGIVEYDFNKDQFSPAFTDDTQKQLTGTLSYIFQDNKERLWIGTHDSLLYEVNQQQVTIHRLDEKESDGPIFIKHIQQDAENRLWISTSHGIWIREKDGSPFLTLTNNSHQYAKWNRRPAEKVEFYQGGIFIASYDGFYHLDAKSLQLENLSIVNKHEDPRVRSLSVTSDGIVWLSTFSGLKKYDAKKKEFVGFTLDEKIFSNNSVVNTAFVDSNNVLWIGSEFEGAFYSHLITERFGLKRTENQSPDCLSGNAIFSLSKEEHDQLLVAVWGEGLHILDYKTNRCQVINQHDNEDISRAIKSIMIMKKEGDSWWFGTSGNGLLHYKPKTQKFTLYASTINSKPGFANLDVFGLARDEKDNLWAGTLGGLYKLHSDRKTLLHYSEQSESPKKLLNNEIQTIAMDVASESLWIATNKGVDRMFLETETFTREQLPDVMKNVDNAIYALKPTPDGGLWMGTASQGLYYFDGKDTFKHFTEKSGLPNNTIYALELDTRNKLWGSTNNGIFRLDTKDYTIRHYGEAYGLQNKEFSPASSYDAKNNTLYFAGLHGLNEIDLEQLNNFSERSTPVIDEFLIDNKSADLITEPRYTKGLAIQATQDVTLEYSDKFVGFKFNALRFFESNDVKYRYQLKGYDDRWISTSSNNRVATFTNLPVGKFDLLINATDSSGQWGKQVGKLNITVNPPWWLTWWAKAAYVLLAVFIPTVIYIYRTHAIRKRAEELEVTVNLRTQELAVQKTLVEKLLHQKNNDFINVSHEFRTPITLILGPVKKLLTHAKQEQKAPLGMIRSNAERLLKLVDELLEIERLKVNKALPKQRYALDELVSDIASAYELASHNGSLTFTSSIEENIQVEVFPDAIEKILSNLLSNAIKYNVEGGTIELMIKAQGEHLIIKVKDTGIGIPKEVVANIFQKFNRGEEGRLQAHGSGVGLAVVQEIANAHQGNVEVISNKDKGTLFTIDMPCVVEVGAVLEENIESVTQADDKLMSVDSSAFDDIDEQQPLALIIEDDTDMRQYLGEVVEANYQCIKAHTGEVGIELAQEMVPDIIICDIMMPGITGHQVCQQLKMHESTSHIPILMLTARVDKESRIQSWKLLADEYLTKPFDDEELLIRLDSLLSIRKKLQRYYTDLSFDKVELASTNASDATLETQSSKDDKKSVSTEKDEAFVVRLKAYLEEYYASEDLSVTLLAQDLHLSERQFRRKIKALLGVSPMEFVRNFRMEKASVLLKGGEVPSNVYLKVGYSSHTYFSREFKKYTGKAPSDFN